MSLRSLFVALLMIGLALAAALLAAGHALTRAPADRSLSLPVASDAQSFVLQDAEGRRIAATALSGRLGGGAVLLLHPRKGSRLTMWQRAQVLQREGMAVLLIDQIGHGGSDGDRLGFGYQERLGALAAWDWMNRQWPAERKAVVGASLGAAAWVFADASPKPSAVVLEALYTSLDEALGNRLRMRLGNTAATLLTPLLGTQAAIWSGANAGDQRPIDRISRLGAPLLLVAGSQDLHATADQSRRLLAAAVEPKALWMVEGAAHTDFQAYDPVGYREQVIGFLIRHLQQEIAS